MDIHVRFATETDVNILKHIWKVCFDDPDTYIRFFFTNCFNPQNAVVACVDNKPVGVIHLLPAKLGEQRFLYGYAIGVLPEFRGNNICQIMHDFVARYAERENAVYGLHPANEKLFSFYHRIGLSDMYSLRLFDASELSQEETFLQQDIEVAEYYRMRNEVFAPLVCWEEDMLAYILKEAKHFGGFAKKITLTDGERILFGRTVNDTVYIKETTMSDEEILRTGGYLKKLFGATSLHFLLPNSSSLGKETTTVLGFGEKNPSVYMNLFLD